MPEDGNPAMRKQAPRVFNLSRSGLTAANKSFDVVGETPTTAVTGTVRSPL
jgi:hypothetical protein